jgi:hypothetical protein
MFESYDGFEDHVRQFDDELTDEGIYDFSGLILGSGALAYHMEEDGRDVNFDMKDIDIFANEEDVDAIADMPYGARTPDRRFNGGIYQLDDEREELNGEVGNWDISTGEFSECKNVDMMTIHYNTQVEWQLKADLNNGEGHRIDGVENDIRVVPLSTYLTTKEYADREQDEEHVDMAKLLIGNK